MKMKAFTVFAAVFGVLLGATRPRLSSGPMNSIMGRDSVCRTGSNQLSGIPRNGSFSMGAR